MESRLKTEVDAELIANATGELFDCLLTQNLAYINRFHSGGFIIRLKSILRYAGLGLSLLGTLLCVIVLLLLSNWCPAWLSVWIYLPLFVAGVFIFYFLPKLDQSVRRWTERNAHNNCRRRANRSISQLRKLIPVTVEYDIKGDLITCFRRKDERSSLAWSRRLTGVALQGNLVTAIFRKSTSIQPRIIILHRDGAVLRNVLSNLSVEIRPIVVNQP